MKEDRLKEVSKDDSWQVRAGWIELLTVLARECMSYLAIRVILDAPIAADFPGAISLLVKMTATDGDEDVRRKGVKSLSSVAEDGTLMLLHLPNLTNDVSL